MGAWGHNTIENDDALDWLGELTDLRQITAAFAQIVDNVDGYIDLTDASAALAAAEVVAALNGRPSRSLPDEARSWIHGKTKPDTGLLQQARTAVEQVLAGSELEELWDEDGTNQSEWHAVVNDLKERLA